MTKIRFGFDQCNRPTGKCSPKFVERKLLQIRFMAKSIICVVDFSESSQNALQTAADLSAQNHTHLTVLYPYRLLQTSRGEDLMDLKKRKEAEAASKFAVLEKSVLKGKDVSFEFSSEIGFITDRIESRTRKLPIQFLVIGKSLLMANKESFEELLTHLASPLIIVP